MSKIMVYWFGTLAVFIGLAFAILTLAPRP